MYKPLLTLAVLSASLPCVTQTPSDTRVPKATSSTPSYAEEAVVVERDDVVYHFAPDGTGSKL